MQFSGTIAYNVPSGVCHCFGKCCSHLVFNKMSYQTKLVQFGCFNSSLTKSKQTSQLRKKTFLGRKYEGILTTYGNTISAAPFCKIECQSRSRQITFT